MLRKEAVDERDFHEKVRSEVQKIQLSQYFRKAPACAAFLSYLIEEELANRGCFLKESVIAIEHLKLSPNTDFKKCARVRVLAAATRDRLNSFYNGRGAMDEVFISIPRNTLRAEITFRVSAIGQPLQRAEHSGLLLALEPVLTYPDGAKLGPLAKDLGMRLLEQLRAFPGHVRVELIPVLRGNQLADAAYDYVLHPLVAQVGTRGPLLLAVTLAAPKGDVLAIETANRPEHEWNHLVEDIAPALSATISGTHAINADCGAERVSRTRDFLDALEANSFLEMRTPEGITQAGERFDQIMERRPSDPAALAGSAETILIVHQYRTVPAQECWNRALQLSELAVHHGAQNSEAHTVLAYSTLLCKRQFLEARSLFEKALALKPSNHRAHQWFGNLLEMLNLTRDSKVHTQAALQLKPNRPIILKTQGDPALYARDYDEAIRLFSVAIDQCDLWISRLFRALSLALRAYSGDAVQADEDLSRAAAMNPAARHLVDSVAGFMHARLGHKSLAEGILRQLIAQRRPGLAHSAAAIYAGLGEIDNAINAIEEAIDDPIEWLYWFGVDPRFDPLRKHPKYDRILERLGLVDVVRVNVE